MLFVFHFSAHISLLNIPNNLFYFSTCLPRVLECLGLLIVVFRLFKNSVEAPYNGYTSRNSQKSSQDSRWNNWFPDGFGRPDCFHWTSRRWKAGLEFWCFQLFQLPFLHLFKEGVFSSSSNESAAQNSIILFSKVSKHTCNPLEPK